MKKIIIFAIILLVSCSNPIDVQVENLVTNKNLWLIKSNGKDYTYKLIRSGGGNSKATENIVVVKDGVSSIKIPERLNKEPFPYTAEGLFQTIFYCLKNDITVSAEYHKELGVPVNIKINNTGMHGLTIMEISDFEFI